MWSIGRFDLGLSEDEFWRLTPSLFYALLQRWEMREDRDYFRAGIVASTIANVNRDTKKKPKPFKVEDFMPRKGKKKKPMYTDEQRTAIERINKLLGISADYIGAKRGRGR